MSALVFIAGYIGFKLKRKVACIGCRLELFTEKALECDMACDETFRYMTQTEVIQMPCVKQTCH